MLISCGSLKPTQQIVKVKVKLSLCVINETPRHEDVWERGDIAPPFLTSALDGGQRSASRPGRFTSWEIDPGTHWIGDWWAPEPTWLQWRDRNLPCRESNQGRQARSPSLCRLGSPDAATEQMSAFKGNVKVISSPKLVCTHLKFCFFARTQS
jgi:hypothetical protein